MASIDTALIVAAGRSSRLYPLTLDTPKGLLRVGAETMLGRSVRLLRERGVARVVLVVGYLQELIRAALGSDVVFVNNPFFAQCNNMGSMWMARREVEGRPFLYLHGDLIYSGALLDRILARRDTDASLLVQLGEVDEEAMKVRVRDGKLVESSKQIPLDEAAGEWIGIARFSAAEGARAFAEAERCLVQGHLDAYDTMAFTRMAQAGSPFSIVETGNDRWIEVDDASDLARAQRLFDAGQ